MGEPALKLAPPVHSSFEQLKDDDWLSFLETHGLLRILKRAGVKATVVELDEGLWRAFRRPKQAALPGDFRIDPPTSSRRMAGDVPPRPATPADFLQTLRQRRAQSAAEPVRVAGISLPGALRQIAERIRASQSILDFEEDWDGEGSPEYAEETWLRAAGIVAHSATDFWRTYGIAPPVPVITPGPDSSIDISWQTSSRRILINVPSEPNNVATFYGRDLEMPHQLVKGEMDPSVGNEWLIAWLLK